LPSWNVNLRSFGWDEAGILIDGQERSVKRVWGGDSDTKKPRNNLICSKNELLSWELSS
jgi:hypothetical protein